MTLQTTFPGLVVLHAVHDVLTTRQMMLRDPADPTTAVVAVDLDPLPAATDLNDVICRAVAEAAAKAWPGCYDTVLSTTFDKGFVTDAALNSAITSAGLAGRVSAAWLRAAASLVAAGMPPLPPQNSLSELLTPLASVFGPAPVLLVSLLAAAPAGERLDALGRALVSIASKTPFRVHLVVPVHVAASMELDQVNYLAAAAAAANSSRPVPDEGDEPGDARGSSFPTAASSAAAMDEPTTTLSSAVGKPHPESPGEQKLARWLAEDRMLGGLFHFNQTVHTARQSRYRVDLVWPEGRVVIEVDGYRTHSTPHQFRFDRHRDYELALTGYLVLRLTHQEVMQDTAIAVEKIRDVVRVRGHAESGHEADPAAREICHEC